MLKKVIPIVLMLCLIFSISVMAEKTNAPGEEFAPAVSEPMPQYAEERPQGVRGNMGTPPFGNMQNYNQQSQAEQHTGFLGFIKTYSTPITSVILLILAFFFVIFYRRKNY